MPGTILHKVSTTICKSHAVVVIEDLKVKGMSASASGTKERPGKNVRQKAGLNRSILDQGWGAFVRMLDYKSAWKGGMVLRVDPRNTSRTCSSCGHVSPDSRKTQTDFLCIFCGFGENADTNAARNIIKGGTRPDSLWNEHFARTWGVGAGTRRSGLDRRRNPLPFSFAVSDARGRGGYQPVTDINRARAFYEGDLGLKSSLDFERKESFRS